MTEANFRLQTETKKETLHPTQNTPHQEVIHEIKVDSYVLSDFVVMTRIHPVEGHLWRWVAMGTTFNDGSVTLGYDDLVQGLNKWRN